jgi:putative transposase
MNKKKILRIMKKYHLRPPRLWYQKKYITKQNFEYRNQFGNLIKDVKWPKENEVWASDLTYIKFQDKFIYLSTIQDISTKEVVSCNLGSKHDSVLVLETIREAIKKYGKLPKIFHSDRGTEFLNEICIRFFKENHIQISVSDPGSPWQNGHSESFFSRFKTENGIYLPLHKLLQHRQNHNQIKN